MDHPKEEKINQWLKSNPNPTFKMTFKNVILNDEKSSEGLVTDHNISEEFQSRIEKRDKIDFESDFVGDLFYFLQLDEHAEMSQADLNDLSKYAEKIEDFICSNVEAIGRISDKDVLLNVISDLFLLFDKEPNIKLDKEKFKKEFVKEVKDLGLEFLENETENLSVEIAALVGGRSVTLAKIAYQIFKKGIAAKSVFDESVDVTFDEDDDQDFYDRFSSSHALGNYHIRQFFIEEISIPLKRLFIKKRMDTGLLTDKFFNNQYKTFINSRFYSKISMLSHEEYLKLSQIVDQDEKDTLLFILLSKRKFNKYISFFK